MTGPEHYRKAEEVAAKAHELGQEGRLGEAAAWAALAQIHATLALAAATALGERGADGRTWHEVAGIKY